MAFLLGAEADYGPLLFGTNLVVVSFLGSIDNLPRAAFFRQETLTHYP